MAYDEHLTDRITHQLNQKHIPFEEKRMMGGLCFMVNEKMCIGISNEKLMVRIDPRSYDELLKKPGAQVMDFTKRPM